MKKIYSFLAMALISMVAMAQNMQLPGQLTVTINGMQSQQSSNVFFNIHDDDVTADFSLPNFTLIDKSTEMAVGNIFIPGITLTQDPQKEELLHFEFTGNIQITDGDDPNKMWLGPMLGDVPMVLKGTFDENTGLVVDIDIDMQATLGQTITVNFTSEPNTLAFTDKLVVDIDGMESEQTATVYIKVDDQTQTQTFILPNFVLSDGSGNDMAVGNIVLPGIELIDENENVASFSFDDNINITAGDDSQPFWMGPMLGPVPVKLKGYLNRDMFKIYVTIDIDMQSLGQTITVTFGTEKVIEGIHTLSTAQNARNLRTYDLQGRLVNKDVKGLMIQNGKKTIK